MNLIHKYKNNGYNIVLDVNSGAVHVVDDCVYDLLDITDDLHTKFDRFSVMDVMGAVSLACQTPEGSAKYSVYSTQEIAESVEEIMQLISEGALYTPDTYEDSLVDYKKRQTVVKALCLHISHDCNLACRYCFAEEGEYHGRRALMTPEVGKRALDFLVENSGSRRNLEVDFFGGEPLMNWDTVVELVRYGRSLEEKHDKHFRFTLTTNGTLLKDEMFDFINAEMDNVVLSIDGRREINDLMRPHRGGQGSYDEIVPKYKRFVDKRVGAGSESTLARTSYYVRGTYTRNNLDFSEDVKHLADLGFDQISVEPVVAKPEDDYSIREEDIPKLLDEYDKLARLYLDYRRAGKPFNFFHFMIDLEGGPCVYKRLSGCGSGTEYLAVTPWGDLYPCHQFVGNEDFLLGNVYDGISRTDIVDEFKCCNVYAKPGCRDCFARFYCSGGCAANAYNFHGSITDVYEGGCELQRKRIECAIMIKAALADMQEEGDMKK